MSFFSKAIDRVSELKEMVDGIMAAVGQVESVVDAVSEVAEDVMEIVDRDDGSHEGDNKSKGKGKEEKPSSGKAEASAAASDATASASAGKTGASTQESGADVADTLADKMHGSVDDTQKAVGNAKKASFADKVHGSLDDAEEAVGDAKEASAEMHVALDTLEQLAEEGVSAGGVLSNADAAAMEDAAATALSNAQAAAAHAGVALERAGHSAADAARSLGDAAADADWGAKGTEILEEMLSHSEAAENVAEAGGKLTNNLEEGLTDFSESLGAELAGSAEAAAAAGEFTGEAMSENLERGVGDAALEGDLGSATTESSLDIAGDAARALLENLTESSGMEGSLGGNNAFMEMITNASLMDLLKHNSSELEMVVGNSSFQELCMSHLDDLDASRALPEEEEDMTMVYIQMAIDYIKLYGAVVARAIWAGILAAIAWLARIGMGFAIGIALWAVLLGVATMFLNQTLSKQKLRPA